MENKSGDAPERSYYVKITITGGIKWKDLKN